MGLPLEKRESGFLEKKEGVDKPSNLKILTSLFVAAYL